MNERRGGMHISIDRSINFQSTATRLINAVADTETETRREVWQLNFKAVQRRF